MSNAAKVRVLVVDDEKELRECVVGLFRAFGFTVEMAHSGERAWDLFLQNPFHIVITDVRMQNGSGFELLKKIRQQNLVSPKVFLMTGFADYSVEEIYAAGGNGFFNKPFDSHLLTKTVRTALLSNFDQWNRQGLPEPDQVWKATMPSLSIAESNGQFLIGRGGFFVALQGQAHCQPDQTVAFDFSFNEGQIRKIKGTGVIRWTRSITSEFLGLGVEFLSLDSGSIKAVCDFIEKIENRPISKRTIEIIPAGPVVAS